MKAKNKIILTWVLASLIALVFFLSGFSKLVGVEMQLKNLESWGYPLWLRFPIGLSEVLMGIGLLLPNYRNLTLMGILPWAIVAVITHLQAGQTAMIGTPILIGVFSGITFLISKSIQRA